MGNAKKQPARKRPSVPTRDRWLGQGYGPNAEGLARPVVAHLRALFPRTATPKEIAHATGLSYEAVRKIVRRNPGFITQVRRGEYRAFADAAMVRAIDLPEPQVHNVTITSPVSQVPQGVLSPRAPLRQSLYWHGRTVSVQVSFGKKRGRRPASRPRVTVWLRASNKPVAVPEFTEYVKFVSGVLAAHGADPESPETKVRQIEVNVDADARHRLGLHGWEGMTLHGFQGGLLKIYNKRELGVTRIETCLWPVDLKPDEAMRLLGELVRPKLELAPPPTPPGDSPEVA